MLPDCLLMMLFALQGHVPVLNNLPQPEDADIRDEPGSSGADEAAPSADASAPAGATGVDESAGVELPGTGDSEDSSPSLRIKRSRSSGVDGRDATSGTVSLTVPPTELSSSAAAPKRRRLGRLVCTRSKQTELVFS